MKTAVKVLFCLIPCAIALTGCTSIPLKTRAEIADREMQGFSISASKNWSTTDNLLETATHIASVNHRMFVVDENPYSCVLHYANEEQMVAFSASITINDDGSYVIRHVETQRADNGSEKEINIEKKILNEWNREIKLKILAPDVKEDIEPSISLAFWAPDLQTTPVHSDVTGMRLAIYGRNNNFTGFDFGFAGMTDQNFTGLQESLAYSRVRGNFLGVSAPAIYGQVDNNFTGLNLPHLISRIDGNTSGLSLAAVNLSFGDFSGVDVGFVTIVNDEMKGLQFGGVNKCGNLNGLQLGIVNIAETGYGMQIGILNFFDNGFTPVCPIVNYNF